MTLTVFWQQGKQHEVIEKYEFPDIVVLLASDDAPPSFLPLKQNS